MFGGIPRLQYIGVTQWRSVLLVGLFLLVIGSGIAVVSGVPMQDETDASSGGTITVEQQHYTRASENASTYRPGEVLRGKSLYLLSDAPNMTVQEVVQTNGGPPATVNIETQLVYQARYSSSVIYSERGVSIRENETVNEGNVTVDIGLDMSHVRDRLRELRAEFGSEARVQAVLVTNVEYNSKSSGSLVSRTPVQFTSNGYHIPDSTESAQYGVFEEVREPVPERSISVGGIILGHMQLFGLMLALIGLCVAGGSIWYLRSATAADKKALYREVMHRRFSELIATVESGECPAVDREMESLQDLMFVGEDGGEPVLYFPDMARYIVQTDGTVYGYQFDSSPFIFEDNSN